MSSQPYLASTSNCNKCLLCNEVISQREKIQLIGQTGLTSISERAAEWSEVKFPDYDQPYKEFTFVRDRIRSQGDNFKAHSGCRVTFRTHLERKKKEYGIRKETEPPDEKIQSAEHH